MHYYADNAAITKIVIFDTRDIMNNSVHWTGMTNTRKKIMCVNVSTNKNYNNWD